LVGFRVVVDNDTYEDVTLVKVRRTPLAESYLFASFSATIFLIAVSGT
jgi:hypothetical protein